MSSEALDKTVITDNWQIFSKKLFRHFIHHKKILKVTKFQFKIICRSRVLDKNIPLWYIVPLPGSIGLRKAALIADAGMKEKRKKIRQHMQSLPKSWQHKRISKITTYYSLMHRPDLNKKAKRLVYREIIWPRALKN